MQKTYSSFTKPPKTNDKVRSTHNQASQREAGRGTPGGANMLNMSTEYRSKNNMNSTFDSGESPMDNDFRYGAHSV